MLVARHEVDYLVPLVYRRAPIAVDLWVERIGRTSFTVGYEVVEDDRSVIYGRALTVIVAVGLPSGRAEPLPDFVREALNGYLREPTDAEPAGPGS